MSSQNINNYVNIFLKDLDLTKTIDNFYLFIKRHPLEKKVAYTKLLLA